MTEFHPSDFEKELNGLSIGQLTIKAAKIAADNTPDSKQDLKLQLIAMIIDQKMEEVWENMRQLATNNAGD